jgi:colanic acid biosynthesis protein WcaH
MKLIPRNKYQQILKALPILCVDVVARNTQGRYLLIKRLNPPKKNKWWVIGGRVHKGEPLKKAVERKVKEEAGLQVKNIEPIGYFELLNDINPFGSAFKYHTVSVVFKADIDGKKAVKLDNQSAGYKFSKKLPADFYIKSFKGESF